MHSAQEHLLLRYFNNSPWAKDIADPYAKRPMRNTDLVAVFFSFR